MLSFYAVMIVLSCASLLASSQEMSQSYYNCLYDCSVMYQQYTPVCGTDNESYQNIDELNCARECGTDVEFMYRGRCGRPSN